MAAPLCPKPLFSYHNIVFIMLLLLIGSCNNCNNGAKPNTNPPKPIEQEDPVINKGIKNIGQTCYMNSVVQILASFYSNAFDKKKGPLGEASRNFIKAIRGKEEVNQDEIAKRADVFFDALRNEKKVEDNENVGGIAWQLEFKEFKEKRKAIIKQEDASELLQKMFDWLELPKAQTSGELIYPEGIERKISGNNPWSILPIPIPTHKSNKTMQDLLNNYLSKEEREVASLANDNTNVQAQYKPVLEDLNKLYGKMFVISLNRFGIPEPGQRFAPKIDQEVEKPFNLTVRHNQAVDLPNDLYYELVGFIRHRGSDNNGHYIAYTKVGKQWIEYDDSTVTPSSDTIAETAAKNAYVFFYKPTSPRRSE